MSIVREAGEMLTSGAEFTVTVAVFDFELAPSLSVTLTCTAYDPGEAGVNVHVEDSASVTGVPFKYHWYVNGGVP